jgi:DNA-binding NtrC family response regulator
MVEALRLRAKAPLAREFAEHLTVRLALLQRRPAEAAYLLQQLDPDEDFGDLHSEWLRCRRLQGDLGAAARHWQALLQRGPAYVQGMLAEAAELDPADIGLIAASAPTQSPPAEPRAAGRSNRLASSDEVPQLVGPGPAMSEARELLRTLAARPEPLLVSGETGCGKEIAARMVHRLGSGPNSPFVAINCGALAESLAEAELFGYTRGAFTGAERGRDGAIAQAAGGVLFLDEISAMPLRLQSLLLRVLESGDYRPLGSGQPRQLAARIISAANEDLTALAAQGRFRNDLLYRLQRLTVRLPPLRERREDIAPLARHFMRQTGLQRLPELGPDLLELWRRHDWPGNVRELRNEVESMMVLHGHLPMFTPAQSPLARRGTSVRLSRVQSEVVLPPEALDTEAPAAKPGAARQATPLPAGPGGALADRLPMDGPAPPGGRKVLERRRALLALIDAHGRITRSLVIAKLACAPNTATADLQALEEEGLIRRIVLGNNLRLSYFVAADQPGKSI